tara:strand:- start:5342 stop:5806 length:465 start_codon:yes stop_codon:yes gene_type:complete
MAKYITPTLTITSNKYTATTNPGPTSSPLAISVTDLLDISQVDSNIVTVATTGATLLTATNYTTGTTEGTDGAFIFLKNLTFGLTVAPNIFIGHNVTNAELDSAEAGDEDRLMTLKPGEFAFFPWDLEANLNVDASAAADDALEVIVFVRTGTA